VDTRDLRVRVSYTVCGWSALQAAKCASESAPGHQDCAFSDPQ